jgi:excisionase family DNA binding protein
VKGQEELRKQEAAKYVGCSVRSLENYTKQGRISVRYEKSRTRPVAMYRQSELDRLKTELETSLYAPAVEPEKPTALVRQESNSDLSLLLTRLLEAIQGQTGRDREPTILELSVMPLLKFKEAQRYANLTAAELTAAIEAGELQATQVGRDWKIRREVLEEYIRKNF